MSKNKNTAFTKQTPYNGQISLDELYTTADLAVLKRAITELTAKQDYKTLNTLFRRNPNASKFDTRALNEDIPQQYKRFTKRNGKLCNVTKSVRQSSTPRTSFVEDVLGSPQSELSRANDASEYTYKSRYYDPNSNSFKYINKPIEPCASRIRTRY